MMFKLVMTIIFLSGAPSSGGVVERELSYGPWNHEQCENRVHHYVEMYESLPGFAVLEADCEPIDTGKE